MAEAPDPPAGSIPRWHPLPEGRRFLRAYLGLLPALLFSTLLLEGIGPWLLGEMRMLGWPFVLAFGNAWLLGATAHAQQHTTRAGWAFGWARLGELMTSAALYWLLSAAWLLTAVGLMRLAWGRPLQGVEVDLAGDRGFALALLLLGYLLLRCCSLCVGPFLDERCRRWPRGLSALAHGWRLSRGLAAHWRVLAPLAGGLALLLILHYLRDTVAGPAGWGFAVALLWHGLAWPAFTWMSLERTHALAQGAAASAQATPFVAAAVTPERAPASKPVSTPLPQEPAMHDAEPRLYPPNWSTDDIFLSAAINGDLATLRRMLDAGHPVDTRDREGVTALLRAANAERPRAVTLLLEAGADVHARDRSGRSLLHLLVAYPATLPLLDGALARGLAIDDQHEGGDTPLMTALLRGHLAGARALLERGADPCRRDRHGHTTVFKMVDGIYAFRAGTEPKPALALLEDLLCAGVDPRAPGRYGSTALDRAAAKGLVEVVAVLHRHGCPVDQADRSGLTPLQQAWAGGHDALLQWLLVRGVAVDFHSAVALGQVETVAAMLDRDHGLIRAELSALRSAPLALALRHGQAEMVRGLLERGADPNGRDPVAGALANAVRHLPQVAILELLIAHGANLEAADGDGNTALQFAARDDRLDLAECLLAAGADPNARTERGYPVLQFARSEPMRALLRRYGGLER